MNIKEEILSYDVSRETYASLERFVDLLTEWNNKMNLVSKKSLLDVWIRHVLDSIQLINYMPDSMDTLVDIGSGSGFPGVVLAILLKERKPSVKIKLIESITKKTVYLKSVCVELGLDNVEIVNDRVENVVFKSASVITARAVASLDVLCDYSFYLGNKNTSVLLLKGRTYKNEDEEAKKRWIYTIDVYPNKYSEDGVVLKLSNLRKKK